MRLSSKASAAALLVSGALAAATLVAPSASADPSPSFELAGRYAVAGGAEVVAVDGSRMFVLNGKGIDIVDISDPSSPTKIGDTVDLSSYGESATSVAAAKGRVAVAVPNKDRTAPGTVVVLSAATGAVLASTTVGALPDMVTFDKSGKKVLVANEGEPAYYGSKPSSITDPVADPDPEGSITVIAVDKLVAKKKNAVRTIGFADFNEGGPRHGELSDDVRVFGPGATVAEDLEPEYITLVDDRAFVTLQENNAVAEIDLEDNRVVAIRPLALKNHSEPGQALDASDRDPRTPRSTINITTWPVFGTPMPDAIASYEVETLALDGTEVETPYLITANEGDGRDYTGYTDEVRVADAVLDPTVFPNASTLRNQANLGRLTVMRTADTDNDGDLDLLQSYGTRSASIWTTDGTLVWDSGDMFEQKTAELIPASFNSDNTVANNGAIDTFDTRSDNKGPEPEGVAVGKVGERTLAFVGLERVGGFMVLDVTDPENSSFVQYANSRDFTVDPRTTATDSGPEVVRFVPAKSSPNGKPLVVVANEISGTVSIWQLAGA